MGHNFHQPHYPNLPKTMNLLTSLLAPDTRYLQPLQSTDGLSCQTPRKRPKSGRTANGKKDPHQNPHLTK